MNNQIPTPYVGPRTFLEAESDRFFGRETEARDLLALVVSERLVVFYAQSGAGKSSLVNTCLIPDLRKRGYDLLTGRVAGDAPEGVRPDNIFVFNLLRSLAPKETDSILLSSLTISEFLIQRRKVPLAANPEPEEEEAESVALIIDQFEEIFSTHDDEWGKREGFFLQLAQALEDDPYLSAVLVMREDFIASLDPYSSLMPGRFRRRYYMQRLEHDAALEAIQGPVSKIRPFEEGVAERLVNDLSGIQVPVPGEEPVTQPGQYVEAVQLQVACLKLWKILQGEPGPTITHADLDKIGKVDLALEEHFAERVGEVADRKKVSERLIREWFGSKLITSSGARNMVMRDTRLVEGQLPDDVIRALLGDLVRAEQRGAASFYELTHDRLVEPILSNNRKWFQSILERSSVLQQKTTLWAEQKKNKTLLSTDGALVDLERYAENNPDEVTELVQAYLDASREQQQELNQQRQAERDKLELAQKLADEQARAALWAKRYTAFFIVIAIIAIATSVWAVWAGQRAESDREKAQQEQIKAENALADKEIARAETARQAEIAQSGALIASAGDNQDQFDLAMLLKIEAFNADENARTRREILTTVQQFENLEGFIKPEIGQVVLSPDGTRLASLGEGGVTFWDLSTRNKINEVPINGHYSRVYPTAVNPQGTLLVSGSSDASIVIWDIAEKTPLGEPLTDHSAWVDSLVFSPDGRWLASASDDATIILWDMQDPSNPKKSKGSPLKGHTSWIASLAISSDGNTLASAGSDSNIFLWDISDPENPGKIPGSPLKGHTAAVYAVVFSRDNGLLISADSNGSVIVWDVRDLESPTTYESRITRPDGIATPVYGLAVSPGGDVLAVSASDSVTLWDIRDPENPELLGEPLYEFAGLPISNDYINSTLFLDEKTLVATSRSDMVIWDLSDPAKPGNLQNASLIMHRPLRGAFHTIRKNTC
jgi:WD40 repeat protein